MDAISVQTHIHQTLTQPIKYMFPSYFSPCEFVMFDFTCLLPKQKHHHVQCNSPNLPLANIVYFGILYITINFRALKRVWLRRGFHTLIRNTSFPSPTNVGSHNPPPRGSTAKVSASYTICNSPSPPLANIVIFELFLSDFSRILKRVCQGEVNLEGKRKRGSPKRTMSINGGLRLLHTVCKPGSISNSLLLVDNFSDRTTVTMHKTCQ